MASSIAKYGQTHPKINPQKVKKKKKYLFVQEAWLPLFAFFSSRILTPFLIQYSKCHGLMALSFVTP